jgi:hypothetical protein
MALVAINSLNDQVALSKIDFLEDCNEFALSFDSDAIQLKFPLKVSKELDSENFSIYLLSNFGLNAENDIFQVYESDIDKRIGWIFPIQSIMSSFHEKSDDKYFLNYAYVAYNLLLSRDIAFRKKPIISQLSYPCNLYDFFPEDLIVLIISKESVSGINNFSINSYLPSLCNYGYFLYTTKSKEIIETSSNIATFYQELRGRDKLKIKSISSKYNENHFIEELYSNLLFISRHHLLIFHYLYQVIEYLIDENFKIEFDKLLLQYQNDSISRLDFREKITESLNEKKRINRINELVKPDNKICTELLDECNRLLAIIDESKVNYVEALYKVRSLIVHEYRKIASRTELIEIVENINMRFERLISEILINDR